MSPTKWNSMFSAFRMGPAASGRELCDIDRVYYSELLNHVSENWEVLSRRKNIDHLAFPDYDRYIFAVLGLSIFR